MGMCINRWKMIDYERLGDLDIINTYKDALIQKKGPNYPFKGSHNAQNSNSMASIVCPLIASIV